MVATCESSLIGELDSVLRNGSTERRNEVLRRVTDLFLSSKDSCDEDHLALFDDVMSRMIDKVERHVLIRLSLQLAPVGNAPENVVYRLADSDDVAVAGPLIERSSILADGFLVEIAKTKSQEHLAAIAGRTKISEQVTDAVIERGDRTVTRKIVANQGARFSNRSLYTVVERAKDDEQLAVSVAYRPDVPNKIIQELIRKATDVVRERLVSAHPEMRERIDRALSATADQIAASEEVSSEVSRKSIYVDADMSVLKRRLCEQAKLGKKTETIDLLAKVTQVPVASVRNLFRQKTEDGILILCKAAGLGWPDAKNVLAIATNKGEAEVKKSFEKYITLTSDATQRVMRFMKLRRTVKKDELQKMM